MAKVGTEDMLFMRLTKGTDPFGMSPNQVMSTSYPRRSKEVGWIVGIVYLVGRPLLNAPFAICRNAKDYEPPFRGGVNGITALDRILLLGKEEKAETAVFHNMGHPERSGGRQDRRWTGLEDSH